jgi:polysaccharide biosynthesis PFTS motif protein
MNKVKFFTIFIKRIRTNRIRSAMRGYRFLKQENKLNIVRDIKDTLAKENFSNSGVELAGGLFNVSGADNNLSVRQILISRIETDSFNVAVLCTFGNNSKLVFALPKLWQDAIEMHNVSVCRVRCSVLWFSLVLFYWLRGLHIFFKFLLSKVIWPTKNDLLCQKKFSYFIGLGNSNIQNNNNDYSGGIINWYINFFHKYNNIDFIYHNVRESDSVSIKGIQVKYIDLESCFDFSKVNMLIFLVWGMCVVFISGFLFVIGRWQNALLLNEYIKAKVVKLSNSTNLAHEYLFNQSNENLYRPLWTYEAEERGSGITYYFYSINMEDFKREGEPTTRYLWNTMSWPKYLVWDQYQKSFVNNAVGKYVDIEIVGEIEFSLNRNKFYPVPDESLIVFDVSPVRNSYYQLYVFPIEYYVPRVINKFLLDIDSVFSKHNVTIFHKKKRKIGKVAHPSYRKLTSNLYRNGNFLLIEDYYSAIDIIKSCKYVISFPFTSTGVIAMKEGIHSIYYDPTELIQHDDKAAHGVPIISGKKELYVWADKVINNHM